MKVLIILDDVNQKDQLEMLVGRHDWFGSGSRILITTRDKHLLDNHIVDEVYSVNLMTLNEAIELFSLHAFKQRIPNKDFEVLSNQVVHCTGLLPLALKVLGSFLYGLDRSLWRSTWESLKDLPNDEILAKLKISFEGLGHVDQRLFLDIACFYRGKLRSYVEEILESYDIRSTIRIEVLIEKSLLFISPYDTIEMHDLIQEMAWHIVSQDDSRRSRIWLPEDIEDLFTGNLVRYVIISFIRTVLPSSTFGLSVRISCSFSFLFSIILQHRMEFYFALSLVLIISLFNILYHFLVS